LGVGYRSCAQGGKIRWSLSVKKTRKEKMNTATSEKEGGGVGNMKGDTIRDGNILKVVQNLISYHLKLQI
jgi:hypothetical protein